MGEWVNLRKGSNLGVSLVAFSSAWNRTWSNLCGWEVRFLSVRWGLSEARHPGQWGLVLHPQEEHFQCQYLMFLLAPGFPYHPCPWLPSLCSQCKCSMKPRLSTVMYLELEGHWLNSQEDDGSQESGKENQIKSFGVKSRSFLRIVWAPIKPTRYACHSTRSPNEHPWITLGKNLSNTNPRLPSSSTDSVTTGVEPTICLNKPSRWFCGLLKSGGKGSLYPPAFSMPCISPGGFVKWLHCTHYYREPVTVLKIKVTLVSSVFIFGNHSSEGLWQTLLIAAKFNISEPKLTFITPHFS